LFPMILNGLEFAGGLRESADLRKHKFTLDRAAENSKDPDGPLTLYSRSATTADGKFTASIFGYFLIRQKVSARFQGRCIFTTLGYILNEVHIPELTMFIGRDRSARRQSGRGISLVRGLSMTGLLKILP
jgi:hypothetical protein